MSRTTKLIAAAGAGAAAAYFLDPDNGARRRNILRDKAYSKAKRGTESVEGAATAMSSQAAGKFEAARAAARPESEPENDEALKAKVESEIFRDPDAPKGKVNVDAVDGVITLRGELDDRKTIEALEMATRGVTGVREVSNLLHLPGETPANVEAVSSS